MTNLDILIQCPENLYPPKWNFTQKIDYILHASFTTLRTIKEKHFVREFSMPYLIYSLRQKAYENIMMQIHSSNLYWHVS